ncbi:MAG: hypothetical protein M3T56_14690 [Chloroflexota bacterium]|nr:hypothetical protein [Chloroflexota bacterium]
MEIDHRGGVNTPRAVMLAALLLTSCGGSVGTAGPGPTFTTINPTPASATSTLPTKTNDASANELVCGVLSANSITSGQGSGLNTFELRPSTSSRIGTVGSTLFGGWISADRPGLGTYVCVRLGRGAPMAGFLSQVRSGESGYIAEVLPNGLALPQGCAYVGLPTTDADAVAVIWKADCGAAANRNARGTLGPSFTQQGWSSCASGLATEIWRKDTSRLTVSEGSGSPGEYPTLSQRIFLTGGGGPSNAGC